MFIELEPIFNNIGLSKSFCYEFRVDGFDAVGGVSVKGSVKNRAGIVSLTAEADFVLDTVCDRCAAPVKMKMSVPVQHTLVPHLNDEDNDELYLIEDMHFNLDELVREDVLLSIPTKILCREDCKGLCPYCGADLNKGECGCKKPVDPRLEELKRFLD